MREYRHYVFIILLVITFLTLALVRDVCAVQPQVAAGGQHTVGLKSDGTVVAVGYNTSGQCNVNGWSDIIQASAGGFHTGGLKSDGTAVAVENNELGQYNVYDRRLLFTEDEEHLIKNFGESRKIFQGQIVNPEAGKNLESVVGFRGVDAIGIYNNYRVSSRKGTSSGKGTSTGKTALSTW
jgi:hypothetical protein